LSLEAASRGAALAVAVERDRMLLDALCATAALLGAAAVEAHCADARAFAGRERRDFDVIFLDPPFSEDPWTWLLPACAQRLVPGGLIYAEAGHAVSRFGIDKPARDKTLCACRQQPRPGIFAERRIEKNHIEVAALTASKGSRIRTMGLDGGRAEQRSSRAQRIEEHPIALDGDRKRGPSGRRLQ